MLFILSCTACGGLGAMHYDLCQTIPICVDSSIGSDSNDGRGWDSTVKTLSRAIELVSEGGEIWVKESTVNTSSVIISKNNIGIYGGFGGTESRREERDSTKRAAVTSSLTTANNIRISANITNIYIDGLTFSGISNSSYNIINLGTNSGVSILNCAFTGNTAVHQVYSDTGSILTVDACTFANNTSTNSGTAISINSGTVTITGSSFSLNYSPNGGAIIANGSAKLNISGSDFRNNTAGGSGGALFLQNTSTAVISHSTIEANKVNTYHGGGLYLQDTACVTINDSTISNNSCIDDGGGCALVGSSTLNINRCTVSKNSAGISGGAVYSEAALSVHNSVITNNISGTSTGGGICSLGTLAMSDSTVSSNHTTGSGAHGGGLYSTSTANVTNCVFNGNYTSVSTSYGGAICSTGSLTVSDTSFTSNNSTNNGGAIYSSGSTLSIADSSFTSNYCTTNAGAVYTAAVTSTNTISKCLFESNFSTTADGGAIFCQSGNTIIISDSSFTNNKAQYSSGGGAFYLNNNSASALSVSVYNSLFYNNIGTSTGTIGNLLRYYSAAITGTFNAYNCTIINPSALSPFGYLSAVGTANLYNTVIYSDSSSLTDTTSTATCTGYSSYTNVSSGQTGCTILPALADEFADFSGGNFRLSSTSQLINAGNNSYVSGSYDLDNTARIKGGLVDIGAYEKR